jgi:hypothetical protein
MQILLIINTVYSFSWNNGSLLAVSVNKRMQLTGRNGTCHRLFCCIAGDRHLLPMDFPVSKESLTE